MKISRAENIEAYIKDFPKEVQKVLNEVRYTIQKAAPEATEAIKYAIPTFVYKGKNLIHFAGYKNHVGLYATPSGHHAFKEELSKYKQGKGSVQFPLDKPMPLKLIAAITKFRVKELDK